MKNGKYFKERKREKVAFGDNRNWRIKIRDKCVNQCSFEYKQHTRVNVCVSEGTGGGMGW